MSPSAAAPKSASVTAWQSASASEWPARPCVCGDLDAAEDQLAPGDQGVRVPAFADAPDRAARLHRPLTRDARSRTASASAKSSGRVTLKFSDEPRHQPRRRGPCPSIALASSVTCAPALLQRLGAAGRGETSAASAPATCRRAAASPRRGRRASLLQRVGHRQRRAGRRPASSAQASISAVDPLGRAPGSAPRRAPAPSRRRRRRAAASSAQARRRPSAARVAPPQRATAKRCPARHGDPALRTPSSSGASATSISCEPRARRPAPRACARPSARRRARRTAWDRRAGARAGAGTGHEGEKRGRRGAGSEVGIGVSRSRIGPASITRRGSAP